MRSDDGRPADTSPLAWEKYLEVQRRMSPAEKLQAVFDLTELVERLSEAGVRGQHPAASDREVFLRTVARRLGRETMIKVYGWDPESNEPIPDGPEKARADL